MVMILHEKVSAMFRGFDSILVKDHVAHMMLKSGSCWCPCNAIKTLRKTCLAMKHMLVSCISVKQDEL
jgi:hypothetical protein